MPGHPPHDHRTSDTLTVRSETLAGGSFLITLTGAVDHHTAGRLTEALQPVLNTTGPLVDIDLSGVDFLDSTGLARLLQAHRAVRGRGGRLTLIAPGETVRRMLDITGIGKVIPCCPDRPAAHRDHPTDAGGHAGTEV
ncbi:hypothetical protein GCM10019016_102820 [Streptomyces prasinosporus]|uniref:Anti-sigma factor antagonist n=1 Tax=Streptomyces prasinosporus TaxID=68256 RepID=A0ABP6U8Z5_9ACTN